MPLLDHFHPPLSILRHWESFHSAWATEIMRHLNRNVLPPGYFAEAQVHLGGRLRAEADYEDNEPSFGGNGLSGSADDLWAPPDTPLVMPAVFPEEIEIQIYRTSGGATLVGTVGLIGRGNKDRAEARRAYAVKCATYLQMGVGLVIVDVVTERTANLHDELMHLLGQSETLRFRKEIGLYAVAYRPGRREMGGDQIEIWREELALGQELPVLPLGLRGSHTVPLDLEATYNETRQGSRL